MSEFDEYSCFKEDATRDEEVPSDEEKEGCLPRRWFKLNKVPQDETESPPMARSGRDPGQDIFDYASKMDDQG